MVKKRIEKARQRSVSFDLEKAFADTIATKQEVIKGGGHLNSESGYREFPKLLDYI